jgi:hypothetical protein
MHTLLRSGLLVTCLTALACSSNPGSSPPAGAGDDAASDAGSGADSGPAADSATGGDAADAGGLPAVSIDPFSSVSGCAHEHEPFIAVSPQGRVAVSFTCFLTGHAGYTVGYRISNDAGTTWGPATLFPLPSGDNTQANASVAAGDDGTLYMAWAGESHTVQGRSGLHVFAARSAPGTTAFSAPVEVSDPASTATVYDQPRVTVTHAGVVNVGYLSVAADGFTSTIVDARSTDGKTWSRSVIAGPGSYGSFRNEARFCRQAGASGRLFMVYIDSDAAYEYEDFAVTLRHSDDDGATWSEPVAVTTASEELIVDASANLGCVTTSSDLWIYYGLSPEEAYLSASVGGSSAFESTMTQVVLVHSGDGGATLGAHQNVNDPAAGTHFMYPVLASEGGKTLDVAYYAGNADGDAHAQMRRSRSTDGATFAPSALVHQPLTLEIDRSVGQWVGDYVGAAAFEGNLLLVFTDNASATPHVAFVRTPAALPAASSEPDAGPGPDAALDAGCYAATPFAPLTWAPPTPFGQGACTAAQIQAYLSCSNSGSCASFRGEPSNAGCLACLETDVGAAAHGPFVTQSGDAGAEVVEVNYGGCQAHFDGQTGDTGCGAQFNANNDCFTQECGACSDFASPTQSGPTAGCWSIANAVGACSTHRQTTPCGDELYAGDGGVTQCTNPNVFVASWCGP